MSLTPAALALVLGLTVAAQAQVKDAKPAAAPPAAPALTAEGKKFLAGWVGQWTATDATYAMGAQKMQGTLKMGCESVSGGWGALCRGTLEVAGAPPEAATFLMGWDVATGQGHMFEVVSSGEVHDHAGKWTSDKSIALVHQGKNLEGKLEKDACTVTWPSVSELKLECTGSQAGATVWTFSATSRK